MKKSIGIITSVMLGLLSSGCGGGDSSSSSPVVNATISSAFLSDSRIAGVTYTCGSETGVTDSEGKFTYTSSCSEVTFSIGGVSLGSIATSGISPDSILYPADLLGLDRNNTTDTQLTTMLQLLQSLDSDGNPNNGISIDANTTTNLESVTLNLDSNITTLEDVNSTLTAIGATLIPRDYAVAHYEDTLRQDLNISVNTVPPAPAVIIAAVSETYTNMTTITINGEVGAQVWIDGVYTNINIDTNNSATFDVNTSNNTDVNNTSSIVLMDDVNASSNPVITSIFRASDTTLNARDIALMKTAFEASPSPRSFTYTPLYTTSDDYNISYSEGRRGDTVETQDYNVTATITKGSASEIIIFSETVPFSQLLRDSVEVAALKTALTNRNFTYSQQWATGEDYNVTMSETPRAETVEAQTYNVTANITKGTITDTVVFSETIPYSQTLRDMAEIAALKSAVTSRNFTYTQNWATGDAYSVVMSEPAKTPTVETQTTNITATLTKGATTDTVVFSETIPFSQALRDMSEVAAIKSGLTSRNFAYTQQWPTGDNYTISFNTPLASATTEDQSYLVTATITKGASSDSLVFQETVPFSQDLRDVVEVDAIQTNLDALVDKRASFSYTQQWMTGTGYSITFSESKRIPTAIDQSYSVTITITKGSQVRTIVYTELVPTTNVNVVLGDGTTTLINDQYTDAFTVTNGGLFQKIGEESSFIGAAVSIDANALGITSSNALLDYIINNSGYSGLSSLSLNNSADGSLIARYEVNTLGSNLYEVLESLLSSVNYTIDNIDFTIYEDINNTVIDFYVEYDSTNQSYVIVALSDKNLNVDSDITKVVNKDSIVEVGETIVNEQSIFAITNTINKGDFIFVVDDSGSMSGAQAAVISAIEATFLDAVTAYGLDWKATVIGTEEGRDYSSFINDPSENNISALSDKLNLLTVNGGDEVGMKTVYNYLIDGSIVERNSSSMTIVYVSDEPEHSLLSEVGLSDSNLANSYFVQNGIRYYAAIANSYRNTNELSYNMANATGGDSIDMNDYTNGYPYLMNLAVRQAVAKSSAVRLNYPALASSITVYVDGVNVTTFDYDAQLQAIVFYANNRPNIGAEIVVTYSHLDYTDIITAAVTDFDALTYEQKRAYVNSDLVVTFDPVQPLTPLADTDQTYDVTVTFDISGYTGTTTFEEIVLNYLDTAQTAFDALANTEKRTYLNTDVNVTFNPAQANTPLVDANQTYDVTVTFEKDGSTLTSTYQETVLTSNYVVTANTDWLLSGSSLVSQNHTDSSTSSLTMTIVSDTTIDYSVSSEGCCDKLRITVNSTVIGNYGNTSGSIIVNANDIVLLEYYKDGSVSSGTDNATVTIN